MLSIPLTILFFFENGVLYILVFILFFEIKHGVHKSFLNSKILAICLINNVKRFFLFWPILFFISIITTLLFEEYKEQEIVSKLRNLENIEVLIKIMISALLVAPIVEEIFFRKIIYSICKRYLGVLGGILCSSVLFVIVHQNIYSLPVLFMLSVFLCVIYEQDGLISSPIIFHFMFNLYMIILTIS